MEKPAVLEEKGKLKSRYEGGECVCVCVYVHSVHFRRASAIEGVRASSWNAGTIPPSGADEIKGSNRSNENLAAKPFR